MRHYSDSQELEQRFKGKKESMRQSQTTFSVVSCGTWTMEDARWNYFDVPHLNYVHTQVAGNEIFSTDNCTASKIIQKVWRFSATGFMAQCEKSEGLFHYIGVIAGFRIYVETSITHEPNESCVAETKVITTYRIESNRILRPLHSVVRRLLSSNYAKLMSEDLPMRERRAELRKLGFRFSSEGSYGYRRSMKIAENNLLRSRTSTISISFDALTEDWFDSIEGGLPIISSRRAGSEVFTVTRICPHEGGPICHKDGKWTCEWHGRTVRPKRLEDEVALNDEPDASPAGYKIELVRKGVD